MGSFNTACGVSRISIGDGQPAVVIPLIPANSKPSFDRGALIYTNEGPATIYRPFALPIKGKYDDYGRLGSIEKNIHTEAIEKYFEIPIEQFAEAICRGTIDRKEAKLKEIGCPSGMWIDGDIYKSIGRGCIPGEFGEKMTYWEQGDINDKFLLKAGFLAGVTDEKKERYKTPYIHPEIMDVVFWSDRDHIKLEYNGTLRENENIYNPCDLAKWLIRNKFKIPDSVLKLKNINHFDFLYDIALSSIEKYKKFDLSQNIIDLFLGTNQVFNFSSRYGENYFLKLYRDILNDKDFKKIVVEFKNLEISFWHINVLYYPVFNGPQCGNYDANAMLGKLITNRVKAIKKWRSE